MSNTKPTIVDAAPRIHKRAIDEAARTFIEYGRLARIDPHALANQMIESLAAVLPAVPDLAYLDDGIWWGECPFCHSPDELDAPAFSLTPENGDWYCDACKAEGKLSDFKAKLLKLTVIDGARPDEP